jgi:hypothetical protein
MAGRAFIAMTSLAIGIGVVIKLDVAPSRGTMAIGALAWPVPSGRHMARLAIKQIHVAKGHVIPGAGIVAVGTYAGIVTGWLQVA